jgi:uncharacterized membrane protein
MIHMEIAAWIASGLLAALYLLAGGMKLAQPYEKIAAQMPWAARFGKRAVRLIGAVELLGAIGVILPQLTGILPWLSITAAFGLALVQLVAFIVHARAGEKRNMPANVVLFALALFTGIALIVVA